MEETGGRRLEVRRLVRCGMVRKPRKTHRFPRNLGPNMGFPGFFPGVFFFDLHF